MPAPATTNSNSNDGSTRLHRQIQRFHAYTQALSGGASALSPIAEIFTLFGQSVSSLYSAIFSRLKTPEKIVQGIQGGISGVRLGIAIWVLRYDDPCNENGTICNLRLLFLLLYVGILSLTGVASESNKEPSENIPPQTGAPPNLISRSINKFSATIHPSGSTSSHRNIQRLTAYTESTSTASETISPGAQIPFLFTKTLLALGSAMFSPIKLREKIVHAAQGTISGSRLIIQIWMLFSNELCHDNTKTLCRADLILMLIYLGILSVMGITSENSKEASNPPVAPAPLLEPKQNVRQLLANSSSHFNTSSRGAPAFNYDPTREAQFGDTEAQFVTYVGGSYV